MSNAQIKQVAQFLSAYPADVVEAAIELWRTGELDLQALVSEIPLGQRLNELTDEAKQFMKEESEKMAKLMPTCTCGKKYNLVGVCPECKKGKEGFRSKYVCLCGNEEYFLQSVAEKKADLEKEQNKH